MRKLLLVLCLLIAANAAPAAEYELDKGAVEIGGEFTFSSSSGDLYEDNSGNPFYNTHISPYCYYMIGSGFGFGGVIQYSESSQGDFSYSSTMLGPTAIFYIGNDSSEVWPFLSAAVLLTSWTYENNSWGSSNSTNSGNTVHISGGLALRLVDHIVFRAKLYLDLDKIEKRSGRETGINFGLAGIIY